jgi:hypothetical protein
LRAGTTEQIAEGELSDEALEAVLVVFALLGLL